MPVALNSGVFWRRRSLLRRPGTIVVEILDPIAPGMGGRAFLETLEARIETPPPACSKRRKPPSDAKCEETDR